MGCGASNNSHPKVNVQVAHVEVKAHDDESVEEDLSKKTLNDANLDLHLRLLKVNGEQASAVGQISRWIDTEATGSIKRKTANQQWPDQLDFYADEDEEAMSIEEDELEPDIVCSGLALSTPEAKRSIGEHQVSKCDSQLESQKASNKNSKKTSPRPGRETPTTPKKDPNGGVPPSPSRQKESARGARSPQSARGDKGARGDKVSARGDKKSARGPTSARGTSAETNGHGKARYAAPEVSMQ